MRQWIKRLSLLGSLFTAWGVLLTACGGSGAPATSATVTPGPGADPVAQVALRTADPKWGVQFTVKPDVVLSDADDTSLTALCQGYTDWGSVATFDLNGDRRLDLVYTVGCGPKVFDEELGVGRKSYLVVALQKADGRFEFANNRLFGKSVLELGLIGGYMIPDLMYAADVNQDGRLDFTVMLDRDNWNMSEASDYKARYGKELNVAFQWAVQQFLALSQPDGTYRLLPVGSPSTTPLVLLRDTSDRWLVWAPSEKWPARRTGWGPSVLAFDAKGQTVDVTDVYYNTEVVDFEQCEAWCLAARMRSLRGPASRFAGARFAPTADFRKALVAVHLLEADLDGPRRPLVAMLQAGPNGMSIEGRSTPYVPIEANELTWGGVGPVRPVISLLGAYFFDPTPQMPKALRLRPGADPVYITSVEGHMFDLGIDLSRIDLNRLDVNCREGAKAYWYLVKEDITRQQCEQGVSIGDRWTWTRTSNIPYTTKITPQGLQTVGAGEHPFITDTQDIGVASHQFETGSIFYLDTNADGFEDAASFNINTSLWYESKGRLADVSPITLFINNQNGKMIHHRVQPGVMPFEHGKVHHYADLNGDGLLDIVQHSSESRGAGNRIEVFYGRRP